MRQEPTPDEVAEATPGERLLYALGQLYRRWRIDPRRSAPPHQLDTKAVARMRWVCAQVEYLQEGEHEEKGVLYAHLPSGSLGSSSAWTSGPSGGSGATF